MARRTLDLATQTAADIVMDLNNKGAVGLAQYAKEAQKTAIEALLDFINHDPADTAAMAAL